VELITPHRTINYNETHKRGQGPVWAVAPLIIIIIIRLSGPKRDEVTGGWRKLHNDKLHNLYSSPNIITMIKSRMVRWAGHIQGKGEMRNSYPILFGKHDGKKTTKTYT
jgi:hypothetical protein